jgi:hypothetical protein
MAYYAKHGDKQSAEFKAFIGLLTGDPVSPINRSLRFCSFGCATSPYIHPPFVFPLLFLLDYPFPASTFCILKHSLFIYDGTGDPRAVLFSAARSLRSGSQQLLPPAAQLNSIAAGRRATQSSRRDINIHASHSHRHFFPSFLRA